MDIEDMINNITNQDFSKSQTYFDAVMQGKVSDALEQEKISMADKIFNLGAPADEEDDEEDLDDEFYEDEYDEAAEEAMEEEEESDEDTEE